MVLVTGSGSGIGAGVAKILNSRGWRVIINDIDDSKANLMGQELRCFAVPGDVRFDYKNIIDAVVERYGRLDALVNNAGIVKKEKLAELNNENISEVMAINFTAAVKLSTYSLKFLRQSKGAIINVVSFTVDHPLCNAGIYSSSKSALLTFTRQAAAEWGKYGVRVNAIGPGMIFTEMASEAYKDEKILKAREELVPLKRIGLVDEVGTVAAFLLSNDASYVSGQCIMVDGGQSWTLSTHIPT